MGYQAEYRSVTESVLMHEYGDIYYLQVLSSRRARFFCPFAKLPARENDMFTCMSHVSERERKRKRRTAWSAQFASIVPDQKMVGSFPQARIKKS